MDLQEFELQTRFINENVDILQKYLIWKEFISEPQVFDNNVKIEADDVDHEDIN